MVGLAGCAGDTGPTDGATPTEVQNGTPTSEPVPETSPTESVTPTETENATPTTEPTSEKKPTEEREETVNSGRWVPWVPEPEALSVADLTVAYWDYSSFQKAGSPYAFVQPSREHEFIQVQADSVLYGVITGPFSEDEAQTKLGDVSHIEYNEYSLFKGKEYAVATTEGVIIVPNTQNSVDEQLTVLKTVIDTKRGEVTRYSDVSPGFESLSETIVKTTPQLYRVVDLRTVNRTEGSSENEWASDVIAIGFSLEIRDPITRRQYFLFDRQSSVDVEAVRTTLDARYNIDENDGIKSEYRSIDRTVIAEFRITTPNSRSQATGGPAAIGFLVCDLLRPTARDKYGVC